MEQVTTSALPNTKGESARESTGSVVVDRFSLVQGGLIYRAQVATNMAMPDRAGVAKRALLSILITWVPLLILSLIQGRAFGSHVRIPFLYDIAAGIRFLIGLPLLIIAEVLIDPRINHAVRHFVRSGLVTTEELPAFEQAILRMNKLRDGVIPSILILVVAFTPSFWYRETELISGHASTWHTIVSPAGESLSLAGWWFGLISLPLFRVLMFRWVWMILLWAFFLRKVTKTELRCVATHPDRCAGLGFLIHAQLFFGFIAFTASIVVTGSFGNAIAYEGATVNSLKFLMIAFCVFIIVLISAPLLVVTPKLAKIKRRGMVRYGTLGNAYVQAFDDKWIEGLSGEREPLLGNSDIQSLADLANSFSVVSEMKVILIDKKILIGLAIPVVLPLVPLLIMATPADQLISTVMKLLL